MKTIKDIREAFGHSNWRVTVMKRFNSLVPKDTVDVVARNTSEALKKAAKKLGDKDAWKHSGILDIKKLKD
jgi:hypothetical protein